MRHLTDSLRVNGYNVPPCDTDSVGDWQGQEERAAGQFRALCGAIAIALPAGDAADNDAQDASADHYTQLCGEAWDVVGSEEGLLTWTPAQLSLLARHAVRAGQVDRSALDAARVAR